MRIFVIAFATVLVAGTAPAAEQEIKLKQGMGLEQVEGNCQTCHSLSYIPMNSYLSAAGWEAEVNKMIKVLGAQINEADAKAIKEYLAKNYAG